MIINLSFYSHNDHANLHQLNVDADMQGDQGTFTFNNWGDANTFFSADETSFRCPQLGNISKIVWIDKSSDGLKVTVRIEH